MSVNQLLSKVEASDERLEANLSTVLQSVRGTKQYWFIRQSGLAMHDTSLGVTYPVSNI